MAAGDELELSVEKPAAGGRMIARHEGQIVLVHGAVPGERVRARIERRERQVAFAEAVEILDPSEDRRPTAVDPACGGCWYAHIAYARQLSLKGQVIQDAFGRLGRIVLPAAVDVAASPERGYRMRARFHARGARVGFYREGTHDLCDAAATGQLTDAAVEAVRAAAEALARSDVASIELAENIAGDERVLHVELRGAVPDDAALEALGRAAPITGCSARATDGSLHAAGAAVVSDPLSVLTAGRAPSGALQRHAESFFQANRFLLPRLVSAVSDEIPPTGEVIDLYAGVGLFSVALAAAGRGNVTAVEGDRTSAADLQRNAAAAGGIRAVVGSVEDYLRRRKGPPPETVIVDPPRTGISRDALSAIVAHHPARIVYVSCDPPTMARDARRLLDAGFRLASLRGFDLFPNTPHVEALAVFEREAGRSPRPG
jgi:23S rRNA (uracil1939-C5)-methyltransferase